MQCEIDVHNLVLVFINSVFITKVIQWLSVLFHRFLDPVPHLCLELINIHVIGRQVSDFHSEITCCDLFLVKVLAYYVLVPFMKCKQ